MTITRELFGGAITAQTPADLVDASDLRQVPNTQEVFIYTQSNVSIILEILQRVDPSHYDDAIRFHFDSLANDNSALSSTVQCVNVMPNDRGDDTPSAIILKGTQMVKKFNHTTPDTVEILMALYRIESKSIDMVLTFNIPLESVDEGTSQHASVGWAEEDFNTFAHSLRIVDFGLFA